MSKLKCAVCAGEPQRRDQRIDPTLNAQDQRAGSASHPNQTAPPAPGDNPSAAPHAPPADGGPQATADQINRPLVPMLIPEQLRQTRRSDLRPRLQHLADDRHQPIHLRPRGARTYRGGPSDPSARATVRRLIPNRPAICRCDTPSFANALISAHSNALTTSPASRSTTTLPTSLRLSSVATEMAHSRFLEVARYSALDVSR